MLLDTRKDTFIPLYLYLEDEYEIPQPDKENENEEDDTSRGVMIVEIF